MTDTIWNAFAVTSRRYPKKKAFCSENEYIDFSQAYEMSSSIGCSLIRLDVFNRPVGVCMGRSVYVPIVYLGVAAAGGIFVPLDTDMPDRRLIKVIRDCNPSLIICDTKDSYDRLKGVGADTKVIYLDGLIADNPDDTNDTFANAIGDKLSSEACLYIMYTSGSTGIPKGVTVSHKNALSYGRALIRRLSVSEENIFAIQAPFTVDASLKELLSVILAGSTAYIIPKKLFTTPKNLIEYLNENKINTICWAASALSLVADFDTFAEIKPRYLRLVTSATEELSVSALVYWRKALGEDCRFYNLYGPTETTGVCCAYDCSDVSEEDGLIPIGKPLDNADITLSDEDGEIIISGDGVAIGYYNDATLTDAYFVRPDENEKRAFKSGDLAYYNEDNELCFKGRKDRQIKRMGYRIEPEEIEHTANDIKGIMTSRCLYNEKENRLYLFYTGDAKTDFIRDELRKSLPKYMHPGRIIRLSEMPKMPNGKADISTLKKMANKNEKQDV